MVVRVLVPHFSFLGMRSIGKTDDTSFTVAVEDTLEMRLLVDKRSLGFRLQGGYLFFHLVHFVEHALDF